ncbi:PfaB family protein [uncultured Shewanella sp.]|uniref:PfaB family protein n=1 Tax=uncultured Shewanella sp. TaxID=173975 RepID=UPI0026361FA5|nr:PfaB family protein [uncultured Shewanella sp.]
MNHLHSGSNGVKPANSALRIALFIQSKHNTFDRTSTQAFELLPQQPIEVESIQVREFEQTLALAINLISKGKAVKLYTPHFCVLMLSAFTAAQFKWHPHALLSAFQIDKSLSTQLTYEVEQRAMAQVRGKQYHSEIKKVTYTQLSEVKKYECFCQWIINLMNRTLTTETQSHFWFRSPFKPRIIAMNFYQKMSSPADAQSSCIILTQGTYQVPAKPLVHAERLFFVFAGNVISEIQQALLVLKKALLLADPCLLTLMKDSLSRYLEKGQDKPLALVIQATSIGELNKEIDSAFKALPEVMLLKKHYKTPLGSYFIPTPLHADGLTFVYPGIGTVYDKMISHLHAYFPQLYKKLEHEGDLSAALQSDKIYQDIELKNVSFNNTSKVSNLDKLIHIRQSSADEKGMNLVEQAISGVGCSYVFTKLLTDVFELEPKFAMGYSMGEIAMWTCLGVWKNPYEMIEETAATQLFTSMVSGNMHAVRQAWGLSENGSGSQNDIDEERVQKEDIHEDRVQWSSYLLRKPSCELNEMIKDFPRVYLAIDQGETCIISGCDESCKAFIAALGTKAITSSGVSALHTDPAMLVHKEVYDLYLRPINGFKQDILAPAGLITDSMAFRRVDPTQITFISSQLKNGIHYHHNPFCEKKIAKSVADNLCFPLDFPKHLKNARRHGAKLFVEVGADKQNTTLINRINRKDKCEDKYDAVEANNASKDDIQTLLHLITRLICHRVPMNLACFISSIERAIAADPKVAARTSPTVRVQQR